jgi:hypothetical protein
MRGNNTSAFHRCLILFTICSLVLLFCKISESSESVLSREKNHHSYKVALLEVASTIHFVTDRDLVVVPENTSANFNVRLSERPVSTVTATVSSFDGDPDISVKSGATLKFTLKNWKQNHKVTLFAAEDADGTNGTATFRISAINIPNKDVSAVEEDNDEISFITDLGEVTVPEGGTGTFKVKLSIQPPNGVSATVERVSGDSDITVTSGSSLFFDTSNWDTYQTVTLAAAEDPDGENGSATIGVSATGIIGTEVTATETDNESIYVTSPDGGESWFQGSSHEISWSGSPGIDSNVVIELYKGGTLEQVIIPSTPDDGSYIWNIPLDQLTGSTFRVRIYYLSDGSIFDVSDGSFSIVDAGQDADGDGVADAEEMGPDGDDGTYDGNNDGTPDSEQDSVASLHTFDGGHYVTVESPQALGNVQAVTPPAGLPPDVAFPYGFLGFSVSGLTPGGATSVTLYLDSESSDVYYKYGRIPGSSTEEVYEFSYDPETVTGAEFDGFNVILHFVDGNLGDDDLSANGVITDQGGPGTTGVSPPEVLGKDCFIATAAFGSVDAPRVRRLREFRDRVLLKNSLGKRFVHTYYRHSPPLARWLTTHETARVIVRYSLIPVVWVTHFSMRYGVTFTLLIFLILTGLPLFFAMKTFRQ